MRSHAESLERLGVARVDILLCHDIGRLTHGDAHAARVREFLDGGYRAMRELRDTGAVRAIGLGVNEWEVCVELLAQCELDCILLAGRYTLLEQPALRELLPLCAERGVSIICGGPFNSRHPGCRFARRRTGSLQLCRPARAPCSSACAVSKRFARNFRCRCRPRRCSFRWPIRRSRASWRDVRMAPKRVTAPPCLRIPSRGHSGARCATAALWTPQRLCPREPGMNHIDSHQHFWRLDRGDYGWLTPALAPIYRDFLPADLAPQLAAAGVGATILVQAAPTVAETRYLLRTGARASFIAGVVGWVDFEESDGRRYHRRARRGSRARGAAAHDPGHPRPRVDAARGTRDRHSKP